MRPQRVRRRPVQRLPKPPENTLRQRTKKLVDQKAGAWGHPMVAFVALGIAGIVSATDCACNVRPMPQIVLILSNPIIPVIVPLVKDAVSQQVGVVRIALPCDSRVNHHHLHARAVKAGSPHHVRPDAHAPIQVAQLSLAPLLHPAHIVQARQCQDRSAPCSAFNEMDWAR